MNDLFFRNYKDKVIEFCLCLFVFFLFYLLERCFHLFVNSDHKARKKILWGTFYQPKPLGDKFGGPLTKWRVRPKESVPEVLENISPSVLESSDRVMLLIHKVSTYLVPSPTSSADKLFNCLVRLCQYLIKWSQKDHVLFRNVCKLTRIYIATDTNCYDMNT